MGLRGFSSLAILLLGVGPAATAATATAAARPEITVFRCQDGAGKVSLRDTPCPADSKETTRQMLRPQDPAPRPARAEPEPRRAPEPAPAAARTAPPAPWFPPPPLFQCTDFDGAVRFTEDGRSNTRCVPLSVLGWNVRRSPIGAASCRWVSESCVRLSDNGACSQYRTMLVRARSDSLHAFSNTAAFRRSEVRRLDQIVSESCR